MTAAPAAFADLTTYERRLVLAVRSMLRFRRISIFWPPGADGWDTADRDWSVDVVLHHLVVALAMGETDEAAA